MTIQDLGSLGELIAAVATIITLVYLAIQIRDGGRASRFESHLKMRQLTAEPQKILTEPALAKLWRQGVNDPDSLTADERVSFFSMMYLTINVADARLVYDHVTQDRRAYVAEATSVTFLAGTPGFALWWETAKRTYNAEMIAYVEACIEQAASGDAIADPAPPASEV